MTTLASPPLDPQAQENGASLPAPEANGSSLTAQTNDAAVQQNALADTDAMTVDSAASAPTKADVASQPAEVPSSDIAVPDAPPAVPNQPLDEVIVPPAEASGQEPVNEVSMPDASTTNGVESSEQAPVTNGNLHSTFSESEPPAKLEPPPAENKEQTTSAPEAQPTSEDAQPDAKPAVAPAFSNDASGLPAAQTEPKAEDLPAPAVDSSALGDVPAPVKVSREREEDEGDEPASKRTKLDDGEPAEAAPAQPQASETQAAASSAVAESTAAAAPAPAVAASPVAASSTQTREDWGDMTEVQHKRLIEGMRNLKKGKHASLFSKPVDPVVLNLPTYKDVVKEPMDLSTMENKLRDRQYPSVVDYIHDFDLMVNNAIKFNGQAHPVAQSGMMIRSQFEAQLRKLPKPGEPVPEPPKVKRASLPGPIREPKPRESRQSLGTAASPSTSFAPDANSVPLVRRDSNVADRPKRKISKPAPRDLQYPKVQKKKYKAELMFAGEILTEMERPRYSHFSGAFQTPVDPVALGIPNYHQVIKKPMDVSTIRQKYNEQQYENLKEFENDFRLMFKNCYKFNPDGHPVNGMGRQYEALFDEQMAKKNDRLKVLAPPSARESPDEDDDDEEEDEESDDDSNDQQKQLAALNAQLQALSEQAAKLMSQGGNKPAKSKDKKSKSSKSDSKKKRSSGAAVIAPPPPKKEKSKSKGNKAKTKPLTQKEKEEISSRILELPTEEINNVAEKIKNHMRARGETVPDESEMEFNIDDIPDEILHDILKRLRRSDSGLGGGTLGKADDDDDVGGSYAPKKGRNKPMSRVDTANQMAAIQHQIDSFNGGAGSPTGGMESSDDEDESNSESEEE